MCEAEEKYGLQQVETRWYVPSTYKAKSDVPNVFVSISSRDGDDTYIVSTVSKKKPEEPSVFVGYAYTMQKAAEVAKDLAKGLIEAEALRRLHVLKAEETLNR